jgi:anti-anti-sigma factor
MEISDRQINGITLIALTGSIDALTAPAITESITGIISRGEIKLVADFHGIDYTSSAGLRVLLGAVKETRSRGGDLRLAAVQPDVMKVLKLSGFTNILKLYDNVDSALASYS